MDDLLYFNEMSKKIRREIISVGDYCKGKVHWGSSLSCVEILNVLYAKYIMDPQTGTQKDMLIVSKGHAALALYATMRVNGIVDDSYLPLYQQDGSDFPEEITMNHALGIPCSTGSLGLGISYGAGKALSYKRRKIHKKVYVLVGDGECNEGSVWETAMFAHHYHLDNLIVIVDCNHLQADGCTNDIMNMADLGEKFKAFGWESVEADGHDYAGLVGAFDREHVERPLVVIANTIKGKGVSFMENDFSWHDHLLRKELLEQAKAEVGILQC